MTIINTPYTEKEQKKQDLMYKAKEAAISILLFSALAALSCFMFGVHEMLNVSLTIPLVLFLVTFCIPFILMYKEEDTKLLYNRLIREFENQKNTHQKLTSGSELRLTNGNEHRLLLVFEDENGKITKRFLPLDNMKKDFKTGISDVEINFDNNTIYYPISNEFEVKDENIVWDKKYLEKKNKLLSNASFVLVEAVIIKTRTLIYLIKRDDGTYETLKLFLNGFEIEVNKNYQEAKIDCEKKVILLPYQE